MKIKFLGGASEVGRLGMLMDDRFLFDYGFSPSKPPKYPLMASNAEVVFLSHCHVDHSGMIPLVCRKYNPKVLATSATAMLAELLATDSLKVCKYEGYPAPYKKSDIRSAMKNFEIIRYSDSVNVNGLRLRFHSAGHIPGSTMFEFNDSLFTSDLNTIDTQLVYGAKPVKCRNLFIEGTYSGREHPPRKEVENSFLEKIDEVVERGGKVIIPVFAVGRTQEVLMLLRNSGHEVWLDGMGKAVSRIFLENPDYLRSPKGLRNAMNKTKIVHSELGRKYALKGDVIVATSGMMDGGPVLGYMKHLKDDKNNAVLLTGYQVEGSNGRMLLDRKKLNFSGVTEPVNCGVEYFDFSAHCGHKELVGFVHGCEPENVIIYHSDDRKPLKNSLNEYNVHTPENNEVIEI
ncbi:MAG: MBL fold metallo-hydrolase [Thermoplasmatales archaeon]|nr:MBL fold metallo-hydrolase [Thermoplasmatales archaeon]